MRDPLEINISKFVFVSDLYAQSRLGWVTYVPSLTLEACGLT